MVEERQYIAKDEEDDAVMVIRRSLPVLQDQMSVWRLYLHSMDSAHNWRTVQLAEIDGLAAFYRESPFRYLDIQCPPVPVSDVNHDTMEAIRHNVSIHIPPTEVPEPLPPRSRKMRFSMFLADYYPDWQQSYLVDGCRWMMDKRCCSSPRSQSLKHPQGDSAETLPQLPPPVDDVFRKVWFVTGEWLLRLSPEKLIYYGVAGIMAKYTVGGGGGNNQIAIWLRDSYSVDANLEFVSNWMRHLREADLLRPDGFCKFTLCGLSKYGRLAQVH